VYIYENGELKKRFITLGAALGTRVQALSGLEEGQRVALP
jgi:hypothetical protein